MSGIGRAVLWVLAIVGGVFVVRRYGPVLLQAAGEKQKQLAAGKSAGGAPAMRVLALVPCAPGGSPAPGSSSPQSGMQSSPKYNWCYLVRSGDSAGSIAERITGDSSRYIDLLVANPTIPKKGTMGVVLGPDAWDFADGSLSLGTKIVIPQTMNAWIDQMGIAKGGYLPYPPDSRSIIEAPGVEVTSSGNSSRRSRSGMMSTNAPAWSDGFDYEGGV